MKPRFLLIYLLSLLIPTSSIFAQPNTGKVKLAKQIRTRGLFDGTDFNNETPAKRLTLLRVRLDAAFQPAENISTFVQLQDSRSYGSEPNTVTSLQNIDLHQAYIQANNFLIDPLTLKVGRMELAYGGQRLIGSVGWHNVGRAFDGTLLQYKANGKLQFDLFGTKLVQQANPDDVEDTGSYFGGIYATIKPKKSHHLEFYALGELNRDETIQGEDDLRRLTIGTHDKGKFSAIDYEVEVAAQLGKRHNIQTKASQDIAAYMLTGSVGYTINTKHKPRFAVSYDYLSGQEVGDKDYKAFDTLFATNHKFYGFMDYFLNIPVNTGGAGLGDLMARFSIDPHEKFTVKADFHQFNSAKKVNDKNNYGQEVDLTLVYRYHKVLGFTFGVSMFAPGELIKARFDGSDDLAFWSYLMTTANF